MDLGFLSGLLGGQGKDNSMLAAILPMLLGGKLSPNGNGSTNNLLASIFKGDSRDKAENFPPLFSENKEQKDSSQIGLTDLLGKVMSAPPTGQKGDKAKPDYPYELQYNRPYSAKNRDN